MDKVSAMHGMDIIANRENYKKSPVHEYDKQ